MTKSFAILLPYYQRKEQFLLALDRIAELYPTGVRVYCVCDGREAGTFKPVLNSDVIGTIHFVDRTHQYRNPGVLFNLLASIATEDYLVLSNPEVYHLCPVLLHALDHAKVGRYLVYGCKNLTGLCLPGYNEQSITDPTLPWYQHSVHRPALLHFCSVISREDFWNIGGFDPGYDAGYAYEDNDFAAKCKQKLEVVQVDDPYVGHQAHDRPPQSDPLLIAKICRNRWYFISKWS